MDTGKLFAKFKREKEPAATEEPAKKEPVFGEKIGIINRLVGCNHKTLSMPITVGNIAYRSCTKCGARRPFNTDTLAVVAYQLARDERLGEAALPSLALVLVGLVPVVLLSRTLRAR